MTFALDKKNIICFTSHYQKINICNFPNISVILVKAGGKMCIRLGILERPYPYPKAIAEAGGRQRPQAKPFAPPKENFFLERCVREIHLVFHTPSQTRHSIWPLILL